MVLGNSKPLTDYLVRRPRVSGRKMSGTSSYFPRNLLSCDLPYEIKEKTARTWAPRLGLEVRDVLLPDIGTTRFWVHEQQSTDYGQLRQNYLNHDFQTKVGQELPKEFPVPPSVGRQNVGHFAFSNAANTLQARNYLNLRLRNPGFRNRKPRVFINRHPPSRPPKNPSLDP